MKKMVCAACDFLLTEVEEIVTLKRQLKEDLRKQIFQKGGAAEGSDKLAVR